MAKGCAPGGKSDYEMAWAVLRREGDEPLTGQYLCVLEPYEGKRRVTSVEPVRLTPSGGAFEALGVRVKGEGFEDTILLQEGPGQLCRTEDGLSCDGTFGFWRERDGRPVAGVLAEGTVLQKGATAIRRLQAAYRGTVEGCDYGSREVRVAPAPPDPEALVGRHIRIHNDQGSGASYTVQAAQPVEGGAVLRLDLDPRIGEGFVDEVGEGVLVSRTPLRLARFGYYAGKTLSNEDGSALYRLQDVEERRRCCIAPESPGDASQALLAAEFVDRDGDGLARFLIYDFGPGDSVTAPDVASARFAD